MTFSKQIPTASGWYWVKWPGVSDREDPPLAYVASISVRLYGGDGYLKISEVEERGWLFAGPIPEPEDL